MKEKDFQVLFGHWVKANWHGGSAAFELKLCKEKKFNLKKIEAHQLKNLEMVEYGLFFYKIADEGMAQKPFDCFCLYNVPAVIVLMFYKPRKPKVFYMIPITTILGLIDDNIKSIDEIRASKLAVVSAELKS